MHCNKSTVIQCTVLFKVNLDREELLANLVPQVYQAQMDNLVPQVSLDHRVSQVPLDHKVRGVNLVMLVQLEPLDYQADQVKTGNVVLLDLLENLVSRDNLAHQV